MRTDRLDGGAKTLFALGLLATAVACAAQVPELEEADARDKSVYGATPAPAELRQRLSPRDRVAEAFYYAALAAGVSTDDLGEGGHIVGALPFPWARQRLVEIWSEQTPEDLSLVVSYQDIFDRLGAWLGYEDPSETPLGTRMRRLVERAPALSESERIAQAFLQRLAALDRERSPETPRLEVLREVARRWRAGDLDPFAVLVPSADDAATPCVSSNSEARFDGAKAKKLGAALRALWPSPRQDEDSGELKLTPLDFRRATDRSMQHALREDLIARIGHKRSNASCLKAGFPLWDWLHILPVWTQSAGFREQAIGLVDAQGTLWGSMLLSAEEVPGSRGESRAMPKVQTLQGPYLRANDRPPWGEVPVSGRRLVLACLCSRGRGAGKQLLEHAWRIAQSYGADLRLNAAPWSQGWYASFVPHYRFLEHFKFPVESEPANFTYVNYLFRTDDPNAPGMLSTITRESAWP